MSETETRSETGTGTGQRHDDPATGGTLMAVVIGAILVFVSIVVMQAYFYRAQEDELNEKVTKAVPEELARLRAEQLEKLNGYRWVDQPAGVAAIPIDRAMELVVRDQGRNPDVPGSSTGSSTGPSTRASTGASPSTSPSSVPGAGPASAPSNQTPRPGGS